MASCTLPGTGVARSPGLQMDAYPSYRERMDSRVGRPTTKLAQTGARPDRALPPLAVAVTSASGSLVWACSNVPKLNKLWGPCMLCGWRGRQTHVQGSAADGSHSMPKQHAKAILAAACYKNHAFAMCHMAPKHAVAQLRGESKAGRLNSQSFGVTHGQSHGCL